MLFEFEVLAVSIFQDLGPVFPTHKAIFPSEYKLLSCNLLKNKLIYGTKEILGKYHFRVQK